jgi:hypothetical protein
MMVELVDDLNAAVEQNWYNTYQRILFPEPARKFGVSSCKRQKARETLTFPMNP